MLGDDPRPHGEQEVKEAVLAAAARLFAEKGPAATSLREIAGVAAVNHGLIHRHFGTKRQLVRAVHDHLAERLAAAGPFGEATLDSALSAVLPLFLTTQATQQEYHPEWIITGTALTDVDLLGQIYDPEQWRHSFGISFLGDVNQGVKAESYRAYKAVRTDEPAFIHDVLYYPVLLLFLGIHGAGPELTPHTFEQGLFSYPPTDGETGRWSFGPGDRTATDTAREVYWDAADISPFNGAPGRWATTLDGRRFVTDWPEGELGLPIEP